MTTPKTTKTDAEWREQLTPEQYQILREQGTERPWTSEFLEVKGDGMFHCAGCGAALFSTDTKYESGSGWPSFYEPAVAEAVELDRDVSHGMIRTEVRCANCGGHLGHVFEDGPQPTGLRYCINGCALDLQQD
jgi:peptide-methionine (R)-S-oxide reductase